jgi:group I intron endonuclease
MIGIYKITSPSGRSYIGKSINIKKRFIRYRSVDCKGQVKLHRSFEKYGVDSHTFDVIVSGNFNNNLLNELEKHYIRLYNTLEGGLNMTAGGDGGLGRKMSEETRRKVSEINKGRKRSEEYRDKIRKSLIGYKHTDEAKENMRISASKRVHHKAKPVINTETNEVYASVRKLAKEIGVNYSTLKDWLSEKTKNKSNFKYL